MTPEEREESECVVFFIAMTVSLQMQSVQVYSPLWHARKADCRSLRWQSHGMDMELPLTVHLETSPSMCPVFYLQGDSRSWSMTKGFRKV